MECRPTRTSLEARRREVQVGAPRLVASFNQNRSVRAVANFAPQAYAAMGAALARDPFTFSSPSEREGQIAYARGGPRGCGCMIRVASRKSLSPPLGGEESGEDQTRPLNQPRFATNLGVDWRKGWDSNPRESCPSAGFQDRCLKPLGHPSLSASQSQSRDREKRFVAAG